MFDLAHSIGATDLASYGLRGTLGLFFSISGYHKLFSRERRQSLKETFQADGCYNPAMMYVIPIGEMLGGIGLLVGALTPLACAGLILICLGACLLDGMKRIKSYKPLDAADALDDVLYLPEALYVVMLAVLALIGPGILSFDHLVLGEVL